MSNYNELKYNVPFTNAGGLVLLSTQTASASASISFTSGLTSTYKEYLFLFNNIHPSVDGAEFKFNLSTDSGSNYNVIKTSTMFYAFHNEADTATTLGYETGGDLAQSTSSQQMTISDGNDNDQNTSGYLHLFNPSSTTYVKHFIVNTNNCHKLDYSFNNFIAGYANTTSAINAIQFTMASGNIDDGTIQMFGVVS